MRVVCVTDKQVDLLGDILENEINSLDDPEGADDADNLQNLQRALLSEESESSTTRDGVTRMWAQVEIDHDRGVVYVNTVTANDADRIGAVTLLRICRLPTPIPADRQLDVTHMVCASWRGQTEERRLLQRVVDFHRLPYEEYNSKYAVTTEEDGAVKGLVQLLEAALTRVS